MVRIICNLNEHLRALRWLTRTRLNVEKLDGSVSRLTGWAKETDEQIRDQASLMRLSSRNTEDLGSQVCENTSQFQQIARKADEIDNQISNLVRQIADHAYQIRDGGGQINDIVRQIESYNSKFANYRDEISQLRSIVDLQRRSYLSVTRQLDKRSTGKSAVVDAPNPDDPFLDVFYRELEDEYRGSKEEISQRLQCYLPHLSYLQDRKRPKAVDLGCGRGEWLQIMHEEGVPVIGVDNNESQAGDIDIEDKNIEIVIADAYDWLRKQKNGSIDLVTAFHVIEHIPFHTVVAWLKEVLRVLKPGGKVILEMPNPESLIVGAFKFWFDPTHIRPLPPQLMGRLMESLSFSSVQIVRLHPDGRSLDFHERDGVPRELSELIAGPMDYAIICER